MLLLLACWRPGDYTPPQPEDLPTPAADAEIEASMLPGPDDEAQPEPEEPDPPSLQPYAAQTVGGPLTLVDDVGQPLAVISAPHTPVIVLDEQENLRRKVRCDTCTPPVEGWLQWAVVEKK